MFELGNTLREARIRRRLDLMDAEGDTKIRRKYLQALETEEFDVLPGPVFTRGFLRTYANYLGLDGQLFLDEFNARSLHHDLGEDSLLTSTRPYRRRLHLPGMRTVLAVSLLAVAVLSWFALRSTDRGHHASPQSIESASHSVVDVSASTPDTTTTTVGRPAGASVTATKGDGLAHLRIVAISGASWVQVQNSSTDGPIVWAGMLEQGTSRRFQASRLVVTLGYPSAVQLQAGSKRLHPTSTDQSRYVVTATGMRATS